MSPGRTLWFWSGRRDSNPGPLHPKRVATFFRLHVCGCYLWLTRIQGVCFRSLQKPQNQFGAHFCAHWKEVHALWLMHITQSAKLRTNAQLSHWSSAAPKRLASAVRFRPWPPFLTLPVSNSYTHSCRSPRGVKVPPWSPFGVQTRHGCVRGSHGSHLGTGRCGFISLPFYAMAPMVAMFEIFSLSRD